MPRAIPRRNNAKSPKNESTSKAYAKHMETETETINENINKDKKVIMPFESEKFTYLSKSINTNFKLTNSQENGLKKLILLKITMIFMNKQEVILK